MKTEALVAFKRCCDAVSPFNCVEKALRLTDDRLVVTSASGSAVSLPMTADTRFVLTAFGKASIPMALAAEQQLGPRLQAGTVIAPSTLATRDWKLRSRIYYGARNNLPDSDSVAATHKAVDSIRENDGADVVFLFLVSGGGSALLCAPEGVSLEAKLATIRTLTSNGADIRVLNAFRQKLSAVKGGKTLDLVRNGRVVSLLVSDLIDDLVQFIASGPTIPQTSAMIEMARAILTSPKWTSLLPEEILNKIQEPSPTASHSVEPLNVVIASNRLALAELKEYFTAQGYDAHVVSSSIEGNATEVGRMFAGLIAAGRDDLPTKLKEFGGNDIYPKGNKIALLFGGETTVIIHGGGKGGRCQEMALSCLISLASSPSREASFLFLAAGTDGQDGPTDAAGALITVDDIREDVASRALGFLNTSNSYEFWTTHNEGRNHIKCGPTGTNVMDIQIVLLRFT